MPIVLGAARWLMLAVAALLTVVLLGCGPTTGPPTAAPEPAPSPAQMVRSEQERITEPAVAWEEQAMLAAGNNAFALDLYHRLSEADDGNLFFSPYSLSTALAMTYAGAAGETAAQMADALHFDLPQVRLHPAFNALDLELAGADSGDDGPELNIANALWGQQGYEFLPSFLDTLAENYGAGIRQLDFTQPEGRREAAVAINGWADKNTNGKIPSAVSPDTFGPCVPPSWDCTRMVLTNAIYFKGLWAEDHNFDEADTRDDYFVLADGGEVKVPMMYQAREFRYAEGENYQAVQLPYRGHRLAMVIFLPAPGRFDELTAGLDAEFVASFRTVSTKRIVQLTMPRFKLGKSIDAKDALQQIGITDAFSPVAGVADFSRMADFSSPTSPDAGLYIADVLQKAFVEVNEKGTEAAAVTAVVMAGPTSMEPTPLPPVVMDVDRPFIFLIRDTHTDTILFVGQVADPSIAK